MTTRHQVWWGILGCGNVTERKSGPAYQQVDGFELVAVMRRNRDKARDYAERHGVPFATHSADELIHREDVDAVYIATPPDSHTELALQVAKAGKICCVEKPLAPQYEEGRRVVEAFSQKDIPLFVAYYRRTLPFFRKVQECLDKQRIGVPRHITMTHLQPSSDQGWRTDTSVAPGGLFDDLGSHELDLITSLLGPITSAQGHSGNQQGLYTSKDAVAASWQHESGCTGSGVWNFGSLHRKDLIEIHGSAGTLSFPVFSSGPIMLHTAEGNEEMHCPNPEPVQLPHVQSMADTLLRGIEAPSTGKTALHTAWVMDRILADDA